MSEQTSGVYDEIARGGLWKGALPTMLERASATVWNKTPHAASEPDSGSRAHRTAADRFDLAAVHGAEKRRAAVSGPVEMVGDVRVRAHESCSLAQHSSESRSHCCLQRTRMARALGA
eukprot:326642-Rhodomonas_salina.2